MKTYFKNELELIDM